MSRVDVIVQYYKYAHILRKCVEGVLSQILNRIPRPGS
jgi:hypothetical protein